MEVVRLSVQRTGRFYPPGNIPGTHFCYKLSRPQGHSAAGRIMSMEISNDTIGDRTRDLPACSAVPQPVSNTNNSKQTCLLSHNAHVQMRPTEISVAVQLTFSNNDYTHGYST